MSNKSIDILRAFMHEHRSFVDDCAAGWGVKPLYASVFGSRVMGYERNGSDLDVAIITTSNLRNYVLAMSLGDRNIAKALRANRDFVYNGEDTPISLTFYDINHFAKTVGQSDYDFGLMAMHLQNYEDITPVKNNFYFDHWKSYSDRRKMYHSAASRVKKRRTEFSEQKETQRFMHLVHGVLLSALLKVSAPDWITTNRLSQMCVYIISNPAMLPPKTYELAVNTCRMQIGGNDFSEAYSEKGKALLAECLQQIEHAEEKFTGSDHSIEKSIVYYDLVAHDLITNTTLD